MTKHLYPCPIRLAALIFFCLLTPAFSQALGPYRVLSVTDGDSLRIEIDGQSVPVRLTGIDTPETRHPYKPVQPYGPEASAFTKSILVPGDDIHLELDVRVKDRYGRILAFVYTESGQQANLLIVQAGLARVLTIPPNVRYSELYKLAAEGAQSVSKGLWADYPIPFVDRDCKDFTSQLEAQVFAGGAGPRDRHGLDKNRNGIACERLGKRITAYMAGR